MNIDIYFILRSAIAITVALFAWFIFLLIKRSLINSKMDKLYGIKTTGLRDWDKEKVYNRTESTPYQALDDFVKVYEVHKEGGLVDFGAGKGRVSIYLHDKLNIPITGVEINDLTYNEAVSNVENYLSNNKGSKSIKIVKEYAEEYNIKKEDRMFFFFNPFSSEIFIKVIDNIKKSAVENNSSVEVILYYPINNYKSTLEEYGFELKKKIKTTNAIGFNEVFLVYQFSSAWMDNISIMMKDI